MCAKSSIRKLSEFGAGFVSGLVRPSALVVVGAIATALAIFFFCGVLLTERRVASAPPGRWMLDEEDDFGRLVSIALQGVGRQPGNPQFLLLGASDMREALESQSELTRRLKPLAGEHAQALSLCADGLLMEERAALLDRYGIKPRGAVIIGVNIHQLCRPTADLAKIVDRYRLGFRSEVFDSEAAASGVTMPRSTGWFFLDNRLFFLRRVSRLLRLHQPSPEWKEHRALSPMPDAARRGIYTKIRVFSAPDFNRNTQLLARLVRRLRAANGPPVVLLEIPWLDSLEPALLGPRHAAELKVYDDAVRRFAAREGMIYINPLSSAGLSRADYRDFAHVGDAAARGRFSEGFVRQLNAALKPTL